MAASSDPEVIIQAHTHQFVRGEVKRVTLRLSVMKAAKATRLTHWMGRMGTGRCCLEEWAGNLSLLSYTFSSMTSFWRQTSCSHFSKPIQVVGIDSTPYLQCNKDGTASYCALNQG